MPRSPRFPAPDRPDPEARLLAAVAERDGGLARRLAEQFVHRRGVAALESLLLRRLEPTQGAEACSWLASLVGVDTPVGPAAMPDSGAPAAEVVVSVPAADPWAPIASGLEGIGNTIAAQNAGANLDSSGTAVEPGAALIASWLEDLSLEQLELGQLAEVWKPAAESQVAESQAPEPQLAEATGAAPELLQADLMVFGGGGASVSHPASSPAALSLAESSFDNPFEAGSIALPQPEQITRVPSLTPSLTPPLPAQQPDPEPVLRRLQAVATSGGQTTRPAQLAPVPASLARLRSWLHDDQLPEAS